MLLVSVAISFILYRPSLIARIVTHATNSTKDFLLGTPARSVNVMLGATVDAPVLLYG